MMDKQKDPSSKQPQSNYYYQNKRIRRHLINVGLINRQGEILPASTHDGIRVRRERQEKSPERIINYVIKEDRKRQAFILNYFDFAVKRARVQKLRSSKPRSLSHGLAHLPGRIRNQNIRTPSPVDRYKSPPSKRLPARAKSARQRPTNVKNGFVRRPLTRKQQSSDDYCEVTMIYYGPPNHLDQKNNWSQPNGDEIVIMQQHCGGENLVVFKGFRRPNQIFTFHSRRHPDYPFALALYTNGLIDSRISVCCEYKHNQNVRLGSKYGLFGIYDVQKSQPCRMCRFEEQKKKILSMGMTNEKSSPPQEPVLATESALEMLLQTPITSSEKEKTPPKKETKRVSTAASTSRNLRRLNFASSEQENESDEVNKSKTSEGTKDDNQKLSRVPSPTSTKSPQSSSTSLFTNEVPGHSSEPVLTRRDTISSTRSIDSIQTPVDLVKDDNRDYLKLLTNDKNKSHILRSPSITSKLSSTSSSITLPKIDGNHLRLESSLSESSSTFSMISLRRNNENPQRPLSSTSSDSSLGKEDDPPVVEASRKTDVNRQIPRSSSIASNTSDSSSEKRTIDELLPKKDPLSSSATTSESDDDTFKFEESHDSTNPIEDNDESKKNEYESPRLPKSPIDSEEENEHLSHNAEERNNYPSDGERESPSSLKVTRQNEVEDSGSTKPKKKAKRQYRAMENIIVVWLDATLDNPDQSVLNSKEEFRQIARTLRAFSDPQECLPLLQEVRNEKIFLIVSGSIIETILEQIDVYPQLALVYIFCQQKDKYENLIDQYPKIKGVYTEASVICQHLKIDAKQWDNDISAFQISSDIKKDVEPLLFIQNQLFKQYLLEIQYDDDSINSLVEYCENLYVENDQEMQSIKEFQNNYQSDQALDWYAKDCFVYHMLNRAIRMKDIKILFQMGFLIRDIHRQLEEVHYSTVHRSTWTVYRGQGVELEYFEELKANQGGLLSFNGFISTSKKEHVADEFARRAITNGFPMAILFRMKIDPKITFTPFISLENLSAHSSEYEVLLSFKAIFQIETMESIEENLWQVDLILTDQLSASIQMESEKFNHLNDYEKLGELLIEMNELEKAKNLYEINIPERISPKYSYIYNQLALIQTKLGVYSEALSYYNLALQTKCQETKNDYVTISNIYKEIGKIFCKQSKFPEALESFQYALNIQLEQLSSNDLSLVETYDLLAMAYEESRDYQTALKYHQRQLEIQEESSVVKQSDLAATHFKTAVCLENLSQLNKAMDHIQKSIDLSSADLTELDERQIALERIRALID